MAIKIIKKGDRNRVSVYHQSCSKCGCAFEFNRNDAIVKKSQFEGIPFFVITCPECNYEILIKKLTVIRYD